MCPWSPSSPWAVFIKMLFNLCNGLTTVDAKKWSESTVGSISIQLDDHNKCAVVGRLYSLTTLLAVCPIDLFGQTGWSSYDTPNRVWRCDIPLYLCSIGSGLVPFPTLSTLSCACTLKGWYPINDGTPLKPRSRMWRYKLSRPGRKLWRR